MNLIGKRVRVMFKDYKHLEGRVKEMEGNMLWLTDVINTTSGKKEPDRVINTYCVDLRELVFLEEGVSLAI